MGRFSAARAEELERGTRKVEPLVGFQDLARQAHEFSLAQGMGDVGLVEPDRAHAARFVADQRLGNRHAPPPAPARADLLHHALDGRVLVRLEFGDRVDLREVLVTDRQMPFEPRHKARRKALDVSERGLEFEHLCIQEDSNLQPSP